jgi:alkanesulfonate monooxygenase SsuD/methylene tetrahydromethanopterin reductase-like flavin-dependent oxidoreductase (luciferase family)
MTAASAPLAAADTTLFVDLHLFVGQFPGVTARRALGDAVRYARAAEATGFDAVWIASTTF